MPNEERNWEHKRAEYAYNCIDEIARMDDPKQKKYRTAVLSCSSLILKSGLMQTMAFYLGKGAEREKLAEHLLRWISYQRHNGNAIDLFHLLLGADAEMLAYMTSEALATVKWLKCFADGRLKKDEDLEGPTEELSGEETEVEA